MKHWDVPWGGASTEIDAARVGDLLDSLGTSNFGATVFDLINRQVPIAMLTCGAVQMGGPIQARWLETPRTEQREVLVQLFEKCTKSHYHQDPLWKLIPRLWTMAPDAPPGILLHLMNASEIKSGVWRYINYETMSLGDRLVMVAVHPFFGAISLCLFRDRHAGVFTQQELDWLSAMAPMLFRFVFRHEGVHYKLRARVDMNLLGGRLTRLGSGLTPREVQVCAELLLGLSFDEIGQKLGVKHTTIKTFRNRAFQKLGVASRFDLFALMMG